MLTLFARLFGPSEKEKTKELFEQLRTKEVLALYNTLYEQGANKEIVKKALNSPEIVAKLMSAAWFDWEAKDFLPPVDGIPQSDGSIFAYLCRYQLEIGVYVVTHPTLSKHLHDKDIWMLDESGEGDEIKKAIMQRNLTDLADNRLHICREATRMVLC
ncbi:MAG: hypothetical protein H0W64_09955 [Gammaproteobacteria bacterium]|nr:hypothetical protein [Gammaproteobacteria bacterium]